MSREIVACVTAQPASARASRSSNCVPMLILETTLSIRRCRSAFDSCIRRAYVCNCLAEPRTGRTPNHVAETVVDRALRSARSPGDDRVAAHCRPRLAYPDRRRASAQEMTTTADQKMDRAAAKLQEFANRMADEGGVKAKLAEPLAQDADLIRKMKPSLIKARARSGAPRGATPPTRITPPKPKIEASPKKRSGGGPSPWLVVGVALAAGIVLAKWIDWRGSDRSRD